MAGHDIEVGVGTGCAVGYRLLGIGVGIGVDIGGDGVASVGVGLGMGVPWCDRGLTFADPDVFVAQQPPASRAVPAAPVATSSRLIEFVF